MDIQDRIVILGVPKVKIQTFNSSTGEVSVLANVLYKEKRFDNLPILRLIIEQIDEDSIFADTNEEYTSLIPYLAPVRGFRKYIDGLLRLFLRDQRGMQKFIRAGIFQYLQELSRYSDVKGLVREAKSHTNLLNAEKKGAEQKARAVLEALGKTPAMDIAFEVLTQET